MVSAWLLKTTGPAFSTGDSRKLGKKTTSPHLDPHKGWLSLCNRSATCSVCANGTSFQLFPFSEFNFQLRSRSERTSMGYFGSELLSDKAQSSEIKNTSSCSSSSPSRYKRDSVFLRSGYSIHNLPILLVPSPPSCATALHPRGKVCPNSAEARCFSSSDPMSVMLTSTLPFPLYGPGPYNFQKVSAHSLSLKILI